MSLYFRNQYPEPIWVALVYGWAFDAHYVFMKQGWWGLAHNQTSLILSGPIHEQASQIWYFYAQNASGSVYWAGPTLVQVTNRVFKQSVFDNTGCDRGVGFRELDTNGYENFTLTFIP